MVGVQETKPLSNLIFLMTKAKVSLIIRMMTKTKLEMVGLILELDRDSEDDTPASSDPEEPDPVRNRQQTNAKPKAKPFTWAKGAGNIRYLQKRSSQKHITLV